MKKIIELTKMYPQIIKRYGVAGGLVLVLISLLTIYLQGFKDCFIDDAFILLKYVQNVIDHGTWGLIAGYSSNTCTSPLYFLVNVLVAFCVGNVLQSAFVLSLLAFWFLFVFMMKLSREFFGNYYFGMIAFLGYLFNPFLISTIGLESIWFVAVFMALVYCAIKEKPILGGLCLAVLILIRYDAFLCVPFYLFYMVLSKKDKVKSFFSCLLGLLPWFLFSWFYLGTFFPDSFLIKANTLLGHWSFYNGLLLYFYHYPLKTMCSFFFLGFVFFLFFVKKLEDKLKRSLLFVFGFAVSHYFIYSMFFVSPYHWYYVPQIIFVVFAGAMGGVLFFQNMSIKWLKHGMFVFALLPVLMMIFLFVRGGYPLKQMPVHSNYATPSQYHKIALQLKEIIPENVPIILSGCEIGTLAFYSDRVLLDYYSYRGALVNDYIEKLRNKYWFAKLNYYWLKPIAPIDITNEIILSVYWPNEMLKKRGFIPIYSWNLSSQWTRKTMVLLKRQDTSMSDISPS